MRSCFALATALAALAATGCGTTSTHSVAAHTATSSTTESVATKAQFIAQADAICQAGNAKLDPLLQRTKTLTGSSSAALSESLPPILREAVAVERAWIAKLQALPTPPGDAATITKWLTALSEAMTDASNLARAVANEDAVATRTAGKEGERAKTLARGLAQGYGMKVCGQSE